jgi:probable rRNA maturation factor
MPKITVRADGDYRRYVDSRRLREAALKTLAHENISSRAGLTIAVTGDDEIRALNRRYRGVDAPTDVLAFSEGADARFAAAPGEPAYLGDVIISYPRAEAQAYSGPHRVTDELLLLVVHGVLHLVGHDHAKPDEKHKMWAAQAHVLRELGAQVKLDRR